MKCLKVFYDMSEIGGTQLLIIRMAYALEKINISTDILVAKVHSNYLTNLKLEENIKLIVAPNWAMNKFTFLIFAAWYSRINNYKFALSLQLYNDLANRFFIKSEKKISLFTNFLNLHEQKLWKRVNSILNLYKTGFNKILCINPTVQKQVHKLGVNYENLELFSNFIDDFATENSEFNDRKFQLGFVGRFTKIKNISLIKVLFKKCADDFQMQSVAIGCGTLLENFKNDIVANKYDKKIKHLDEIEDIYPILKDIKFLIVPSIYEGFPTIILQGLAAGCHVLVSECKGGGNRYLHELCQSFGCAIHLIEGDICNEKLMVKEFSKAISKLEKSGNLPSSDGPKKLIKNLQVQNKDMLKALFL